MPTTHEISAVIITFNEERYIGDCINSLEGICEEIIVIDSFSTDRTKAICESKGVRFIEREWEGYAATKNFGNQQATYPFILSIDADEVISSPLNAAIQQLKEGGLDTNKVYSFNRLNNYCGQWMRHGGLYPDVKVRLFSRDHTQWEGSVHEQLVHDNTPVEEHLSGDLLHFSMISKADHVARENKYAQLAAPYPNMIMAFASACFRFIKMYIFKAGFLDGRLGAQYCYIASKAKIWRQKKRP